MAIFCRVEQFRAVGVPAELELSAPDPPLPHHSPPGLVTIIKQELTSEVITINLTNVISNTTLSTKPAATGDAGDGSLRPLHIDMLCLRNKPIISYLFVKWLPEL